MEKQNNTVKKYEKIVQGRKVIREIKVSKESVEELERIKKEIDNLPTKIQELFKIEQASLVSKYKGYVQALSTVNGVAKEEIVHFEDGLIYVLDSETI